MRWILQRGKHSEGLLPIGLSRLVELTSSCRLLQTVTELEEIIYYGPKASVNVLKIPFHPSLFYSHNASNAQDNSLFGAPEQNQPSVRNHQAPDWFLLGAQAIR